MTKFDIADIKPCPLPVRKKVYEEAPPIMRRVLTVPFKKPDSKIVWDSKKQIFVPTGRHKR